MNSLIGEFSDEQLVSAATVQRLLAAVTSIGDTCESLADRRQATIVALADAVGADACVWAWGRGWPDSSTVTPVAVIDFGVSFQQRGVLFAWGLDPDTEQVFRPRIRAQMGNARAATTLWQDIYSAAEWESMPPMRRQLEHGGWASWLHAVRYGNRDTWSNLFLLRSAGKPDFRPCDATIAHLGLAGIPWLQSTAEETLPPEAFVDLTPRQRTVMLMLLDGLPRKTIANRLGISELTVGDHIKSIYAHFGVGTSGELAALFLRGR